jgi:hypothetical protein
VAARGALGIYALHGAAWQKYHVQPPEQFKKFKPKFSWRNSSGGVVSYPAPSAPVLIAKKSERILRGLA